MIQVCQPSVGALEERLVLEVLRSGQLAQGPMVERFESSVRQVVGTKHAIAVNNGTSALLAAMIAHGIGPGDEVITSPFTFVATLNAILHVGATPRFVDVGDDFNLDPEGLAEAIGPATRAVLPVHLYGLAADMEGVTWAIDGRPIAIIEDAAQALGASVGGRRVGRFGTGCFSFYATKSVTTGEGGVVTTDDDAVAEQTRILRDQGQRARYDYVRPGFNLRLTELQAAVGVAQMSRLPGLLSARRANAERLTEGLTGIEGVILPADRPPNRQHVFHQYTIRITRGARLDRGELHRRLHARGVLTAVFYPRAAYDYPCFRQDPRIGRPNTPRACRIAAEVLSLPVHPGLSAADLDLIVKGVRDELAA